MSDIIKKISSIEPDDDVAARRLGLRPLEEDVQTLSKASANEQDNATRKEPSDNDPIPDFITRGANVSIENAPTFGWIRWTIVAVVILWLISSAVISLAFFDLSNANALTPLQMAGLAMFIIGPVCAIGLLGYALKKLADISLRSHTLQLTAEKLLSPDETAISRTALMAQNIREELENVNQKVDAAISRTARLKDTLDTQVQAIDRTTYITDNKSELIASRMTEEREALIAVASTFDDRMNALSSLLDTHSANLARSTHEAEQKIQEARISVESAAAKINAASEIVRNNTVEAASTLETNQNEIGRLGNDLKLRAQELDDVYRKHANDLEAMISDLRDKQENLGTSLDARLQKMRDMSLSAQVSAEHLTEASEAGRHTVESLADAARLTESAVKKRFSEMEEMVRYSNTRAEKISETAARRVQDSLAQTRKEISRIEYDMVALQDRLKQAPAENEIPETTISEETKGSDANPETAISDKTSTETSLKKKRKGILGLRPVPNETPAPLLDPTPRKRSVGLRGLRPAPEPEDLAITDPFIQPDELSIPPLDITAPKDITVPAPETTVNIDEVTGLREERDENTLELEFELPKASDLVKPDPDQDLKTFDPDLLRRPITDDVPVRKTLEDDNQKPTWWKGIFGIGRKDDTLAIDQLTTPDVSTPKSRDNAFADNNAPDIISALSALGLSPSAVVDDGCIIEAVNARVSKGPLAMSDVIMHRLDDPVRHLFQSAEADPNLKDSLISFARQFHTNLAPIENNREAMRTRLESDEGRAFLLCDAALNK